MRRQGHLSDAYLLAAEEVYESIPGIGATEQPGVRSDIVYCPLEGGGGFFSVGSIAYTASLSHNNYDNNIAKMTGERPKAVPSGPTTRGRAQ